MRRHARFSHLERAALPAAIIALLAACGDGQGGRSNTIADADAGDGANADAGGLDATTDPSADAPREDTPRADAAAEVDTTTPPTAAFVSIPSALVQAGELWRYEPATDSPDEVDLRMSSGPEGATLVDGVVEWLAPNDGVFEAAFVLDAFIGDLPVATQTFDVLVNHPPAAGNAPGSGALLGEPYLYRPAAYDPDGDDVSIRLVEGPDWVGLDAGELVGVPDRVGLWPTTIVLEDGRGGATTITWEIVVVEPLRDLRAEPAWLPSTGGEVSVFGCCFVGLVDVWFGATPAVSTEIVNAARLRVTFGPLRPGQQDLLVNIDGVLRGVARRPLLVLPAAAMIDDDPLTVSTSIHADVATTFERFFDDEGASAGRPLRAGAERQAYEEDAARIAAPNAAIAWAPVASDQRGPPTPHGGPVVVEIAPVIHQPGDFVRLRVEPLSDGPLTARWGERSATGRLVDGETSVRVPAGAAGPLTFGAAVPRLASGQASAGGMALVPELLWASRSLLRTGKRNLVVFRGMGFDNPAATWEGLPAESVVVGAGEALVAIEPPADGVFALTLRIGGLASAPLYFVSAAAPATLGAERWASAERPLADAAVVRPAHGGVVEWEGALLAFGETGLWALRPAGGTLFGVSLDGADWTNLLAPDDRVFDTPIVDLVVEERGLVALLQDGSLAWMAHDGERLRLTGAGGLHAASVPGAGVVPLGDVSLTGATDIAATASGVAAVDGFGVRHVVSFYLDGSLDLDGASYSILDGGPIDAGSAWVIATPAGGSTISGDVTGGFVDAAPLSAARVPAGSIDAARFEEGVVFVSRDGTLTLVEDGPDGPLSGPVIVLAESLGGGLRVESQGLDAIVAGQGSVWRISGRDLSTVAVDLPLGLPLRAGVRRSAPHADGELPWVVSDGVSAALCDRTGAFATDLCPAGGCLVDAWPVGDGEAGRPLFIDLGAPAALAWDTRSRAWDVRPLSRGDWGSADDALPISARYVGAAPAVALIAGDGALWGVALDRRAADLAGVRLEAGVVAHLVGGGDEEHGPAAAIDLGRVLYASGRDGVLWVVGELVDDDGARSTRLWRVAPDGEATPVEAGSAGAVGDCWPAGGPAAWGAAIQLDDELLLTADEAGGAWVIHALTDDGMPGHACRVSLGGSGSLPAARRWGRAAVVHANAGTITIDDPVAGTATLLTAP